MRYREPILFIVALAICLIGSVGCDIAGLEQDTVELEFFNDSNEPIHILLNNEARAPSNRLEPGGTRIVTTRFFQGNSLLVFAENSLGTDVFGGCPFVNEEFDSENPYAGQISYTGTGEFFTCTGTAFE